MGGKKKKQAGMKKLSSGMFIEKTLVLIKPEAVERGLIGEILGRFERAGLRVVALRMFQPTERQVDGHYPKTIEWIRRAGERSVKTYAEFGIDPDAVVGTSDPLKVGRMVRRWLVSYMCSGPMVKAVIEGPHAVEAVRKMTGETRPLKAEAGSIRGDFSTDSAIMANLEGRGIYTIIHASDSKEEARREIAYWFSLPEIISERKKK